MTAIALAEADGHPGAEPDPELAAAGSTHRRTPSTPPAIPASTARPTTVLLEHFDPTGRPSRSRPPASRRAGTTASSEPARTATTPGSGAACTTRARSRSAPTWAGRSRSTSTSAPCGRSTAGTERMNSCVTTVGAWRPSSPLSAGPKRPTLGVRWTPWRSTIAERARGARRPDQDACCPRNTRTPTRAEARADGLGGSEVDAGRPGGVERDLGQLLRPRHGRWPSAQGRAARPGRRRRRSPPASIATTKSADEICRGITMVTGLRRSCRRSRAGFACRVSARPWPDGCCAPSSWRTSPSARRARCSICPRAALPAREGNQERHHGDRQDVPLLDGPHAARAAAAIAELFVTMEAEAPLVEPALPDDGAEAAAHAARLAGAISATPACGRRTARLRRMARRRVRERKRGGLDDARAGGEQRAGAARGHRPLRAGQSGADPDGAAWPAPSRASTA